MCTTEQPTLPFGSVRLRGVREHLERAKFFFKLCEAQEDSVATYRLMLAAIYSCRAMTELMLEAAEKQEIRTLADPNPKTNRDALEKIIAPEVPYYDLIERIRIHDFHRFGLQSPDPNRREVMFGGPIKLSASKGGASLALAPSGPQVMTTGGSTVQMKRTLLQTDGAFFDENSSAYVALREVLKAFLEKGDHVIGKFQQLLA
jgi:hypothetical protein